jgi:hypothetical protein
VTRARGLLWLPQKALAWTVRPMAMGNDTTSTRRHSRHHRGPGPDGTTVISPIPSST